MTKEKNNTIYFLIYGVGKANGGHYRSLLTVASEMKSKYEVIIINIGFEYSHLIKNADIRSEFLYFNGFNLSSVLKRLKQLIKVDKVAVFHAFDYQSYFLGRLLSFIYKKPIIHTKCGGRNPSGYFPKSNSITLFSQENYDYFSNNKSYKSSHKYLIPNRVGTFNSNWKKINLLRQKYNLDKYDYIFLKISRISRYYYKSIKQVIELRNKLTSDSINAAYLIVGNVQDEIIYNNLLESINNKKNIFIETEEMFTNNSKELIEISDYVIGTGRGFMEGASKSKVMLSSAIDSAIPVLVDQDNYQTAFKYNFSERIKYEDIIIDNNYNNIISTLKDSQKSENIKSITYNWFQLDFDSFKIAESYEKVYHESERFEKISFDLLIHWLFLIKNNMGTYYRKITGQYVK